MEETKKKENSITTDTFRHDYIKRKRNTVSGFLPDREAREYISQSLLKMTEGSVCAMFLIVPDNSRDYVLSRGKDGEEAFLLHIEENLAFLFRATDIICQYGDEEFLVFVTGELTEDSIREKAEKVCMDLTFYPEKDTAKPITVSAGIYMASGGGLTFDKLFGQAAVALYEARSCGTGGYRLKTNAAELRGRDLTSLESPPNLIRLQTLLQHMPEGISLIETGPQARVIYLNPGFYEILNLPPDSLRLPWPVADIKVHPDDRSDYKQIIRKLARSGIPVDFVQRVAVKENKWIWRKVRAIRLNLSNNHFPVLLELSTDISAQMEKDRLLSESRERIRIALRQTPGLLWEVNVQTAVYNRYDIDKETCMPETAIPDFPDSFIRNGLVHPDSADFFREFSRELMNGKSEGNGNFIMQDPGSHCYSWVYLSYRMTYDVDGRPFKAIGILRKQPATSGLASTGFRGRPLPDNLKHHLLVRMRVNLTEDVIEDLWLDGADQTAWTWGRSYSEIVADDNSHLFLHMEEKDLQERFSREYLLHMYEKGEIWYTSEYRHVDSGGNIRWLGATVNLVKDQSTGSIHMFTCLNDIQQHHDWENALPTGIVRDESSGLYNARTAQELINQQIRSREESICALAIIRMVGSFEKLWHQGDDQGQKNLRFISVALSLALGTDCITGRYKEDMIIAFFPSVGAKYDIKKHIEDSFSYLRLVLPDLSGIDSVRFVAGVVTEQLMDADYDILTARAEYLVNLWGNAASDTVTFPSEDEDWAWAGLRRDDKASEHTLSDKEIDRPLSREEQKMAFSCVTAMLTATSMESSVKNALSLLGKYYEAARTYILSLSDDRQSLTMIHEWTATGKYSIRQVMSGVQTGKIPLISRCLREEKPIFMETRPVMPEYSRQDSLWRFIAFPLHSGSEITGFLCVENAQAHAKDAALISTLIPYIQNEQKRFLIQHGGTRSYGEDALTRLPNLRSYMDVIYSLDSDTYSSMGALAVDIPNLSAMNSTFGFEYGKSLLMYVAETLAGIFGKTFIFRTWDAEFVVLFPNTILEVFVGRCTRLRTMLQRRYPRQIRIGYTWAEGVFRARDLVKEAQSIMRCENVNQISENKLIIAEQMTPDPVKKRFITYFQPKINMENGNLIGAEALVRGIDDAGNIVPPSQFIEKLERDGAIRELDLFVLESVLKQLTEWKAEGLPDISISVNMSRFTLFNPTILASVLAIQSHYPEIPSDQIALEITETAGNVEKSTLAGIVEDFRSCGICFELDDFGSRYANLSIFSNIKFSAIKLDRSLVNDLPGNEISRMMVENIVQICRNFNMTCIAEGVETPQQESALLKAGCVYAQGYYYAKPLPPGEFKNRYLDRRPA